jgi:hypothetical protein
LAGTSNFYDLEKPGTFGVLDDGTDHFETPKTGKLQGKPGRMGSLYIADEVQGGSNMTGTVCV